ncbi:hypothetical protein HJG60_008148 [Phyllostomus discolor]|uniref:Uncharacterized protein n=1 Tax=Phyllostomus discolor TaxID=89673 RepID=A0A833Z903_9CHIR|nr:hypothetical protein HJG60_008148 [Phyllostomus discolor]
MRASVGRGLAAGLAGREAGGLKDGFPVFGLRLEKLGRWCCCLQGAGDCRRSIPAGQLQVVGGQTGFAVPVRSSQWGRQVCSWVCAWHPVDIPALGVRFGSYEPWMIVNPMAPGEVASGEGADGGRGEPPPPPRTGQFTEFRQTTEDQQRTETVGEGEQESMRKPTRCFKSSRKRDLMTGLSSELCKMPLLEG